MRESPVVLGLLLAFLLAACEGTPTGEWPPPPPIYKEKVVLDGDLIRTVIHIGFSYPSFEGYVKNIGTKTVHNCIVEISCYWDWAMMGVIDIAEGYPAEGGDIPPGTRAKFVAVAYRCISHDQIRGTSVRITHVER
ncbi:MAG: hypothetical protein OEW05_02585 [Candidatus Aminicenantes bacterium]|nr:hypothetical protein [Candidatus Aminicenantes bacterium]